MNVKLGEASVEIMEGEDISRCYYEEKLIGVVRKTDVPYDKENTASFEAYKGSSPKDLEPATQIYKYPNFRRAVVAVIVSHFAERQYTFIANTNIIIKDGKPTLADRKENGKWEKIMKERQTSLQEQPQLKSKPKQRRKGKKREKSS